MHIGYHQLVITPDFTKPVYLAGFANNRVATHAHDDLLVQALALHDDACTLVLVAVDVIGLFRPDTQRIIAAITQRVALAHPLHIIIAPSHTHHGPDTMGLWGPKAGKSGVDPHYQEFLARQIIACALAAIAQRTPAHLKSAVVRVTGWIKNTRDPHIIDDELTLLQAVAPDGTILATLGNYPCHPEVLWSQNQGLTADYVHFWRTHIQAHTGAPGLFVPGALGGMLTPAVRDQSVASAQHMGADMATSAFAALAESPVAHPTSLHVQTRTIVAPLTNPLYKLAFWQKVLPDVRDWRGRVHTEISLIRIGGLWLACVPGELFPKLGKQLKTWMHTAGATHAGVIGLANDELGYIVPSEDFVYPWNPFNPGDHYEETNSIGKAITPAVMDGLHQLIFDR